MLPPFLFIQSVRYALLRARAMQFACKTFCELFVFILSNFLFIYNRLYISYLTKIKNVFCVFYIICARARMLIFYCGIHKKSTEHHLFSGFFVSDLLCQTLQQIDNCFVHFFQSFYLAADCLLCNLKLKCLCTAVITDTF